jgi:hypothetical protein
MATPELRRGDFVYRDTLFAEVGENKRHPRASVVEIEELLLSNRGNAISKDNVGHWYEAQLIHYGLPRSKEKNTAKMRLLQAINQGTLSVPPDVLRLESAMKKEYLAASRRAKAEAKKCEMKRATPEKAVSQIKKRKQDDIPLSDDKIVSTKVSVRIGDMTLDIDHQSGFVGETSLQKQKCSTISQSTSKRITDANESRPSAVHSSTAIDPSTVSKSATCLPARSIQTARRKHPLPPLTHNQRSSPVRSHPSFDINNGYNSDGPPPAYEAHDFDNQDSYHSDSPRKPKAVQISGSYCIDSPDLPYTNNTLVLRIDHHRDTIWGHFDFGVKTGAVKINGIDPVVKRENTSFGWRSRDEQDGSLRFGRGCDGRIEFDGNREVRGVFYGLMDGDHVQFEGTREYDDAPDAVKIEEEWNEFPDIAYGRA